jgi:hypothetical protein
MAPVCFFFCARADKPLQELITSWREPFEEMAKKVVGHTVYDLDQSTCQTKECTSLILKLLHALEIPI